MPPWAISSARPGRSHAHVACVRHLTSSTTSSTVQWQQPCTGSCQASPFMQKKFSSSYGQEHHPSVCQKAYGSSSASAQCMPLTEADATCTNCSTTRRAQSPRQIPLSTKKDHRRSDVLEPPPFPRQENASGQSLRVCHPPNYSLEHQHQQLAPQTTTRGATWRKHLLLINNR